MHFSNHASESGCPSGISAGSQPVLLIFRFRKIAAFTFWFRSLSGAAELGHTSFLSVGPGGTQVYRLMVAVGLSWTTSRCSDAYQPFSTPNDLTLVDRDLKRRDSDQTRLYRIGG